MLLFLLISGCIVNNKMSQPYLTTKQMENTQPVIINGTSTLTYEIENTKTPTLLSPTLYLPTIAKIPITKVEETQIPPEISNTTKGTGEYLYRNVIVTIKVDTSNKAAISYFNLDDLSENGPETSDLEFQVIQDYGNAYSLFTINNAKLYYSEVKAMDYSDCVNEISEFRDYDVPPFLEGIGICVLTNEGRIGVVNYIPDTIRIDDINKLIYASFNVSVFTKKPQ
jgi:hypothetical protein